MSRWTIFSNHGHVLFCLARDSDARLRDVAADVGITERAVQKIVRDLQDAGMISVKKSGRRNTYKIHKKQALRHDLEAACKIRDLIKVVNCDPTPLVADAQLVHATEQALDEGPKSGKQPNDAGLEAAGKPRTEPSKPTKQIPEITETGDSLVSGRAEEQQGSLF